MMNGRRYQVFMAPSAHRRFKKFDPPLQQRIKEEAKRLSEDPHRYEELRGPLRGIRSYHFNYTKTQYRIAYRILEDKEEIEIVLVKSRESFYQTLRRITKLA
ncbi:MAG: type II toxin-antitoxin system RelE/ParE family toxin [Proteobacteria bacterium]|nr:type II toxin-antitoxin system RelE/ParE family toxin [Pseudomonadota bacterium]